ncbi:MAG: energy-coupling factor transporter transmembrane component T [Verrucomicrobiota bacterium]
MKLHLLEHRHAQLNTIIHRAPAELKLAGGLVLIALTVLIPATIPGWLAFAFAFLALVVAASRIPPMFLLKRLLLLAPFVLGVVALNAFRPEHRAQWPWLMARSTVCLLTVILVSNTTPFSEVLRVLRRIHFPALLITTMALMHRYLFVLVDEAQRMSRARASRTFIVGRGGQWPVVATVAGQLFIRASERAERIYAAMCARGFK